MREFFYQGDTVSVVIPIYAASGGATPAAMTSPSGKYAIATSNTAANVLVSKIGTFSQDPTSLLWTMTVALSSTDTADLPAGMLYQQATVADTDGSNETVLAAPLRVLPALSSTVMG